MFPREDAILLQESGGVVRGSGHRPAARLDKVF
jgi:hypothetical protein